MAAKLIKLEVKAQKFVEYSSKDDIDHHENSITQFLRFHMKGLTSDDLKQSSIGQIIAKAVRQKSYILP